jgi:hypothetical protein
MLRKALIALGVLYLLVAALLFAFVHAGIVLAIYLVIAGGALIGGIVFERRRYRPAISGVQGPWQLTGERFVDPTSGRLMDVLYNPMTGERDYVASAGHSNEIAAPHLSTPHDSGRELPGPGE